MSPDRRRRLVVQLRRVERLSRQARKASQLSREQHTEDGAARFRIEARRLAREAGRILRILPSGARGLCTGCGERPRGEHDGPRDPGTCTYCRWCCAGEIPPVDVPPVGFFDVPPGWVAEINGERREGDRIIVRTGDRVTLATVAPPGSSTGVTPTGSPDA